MSRTANRVEIRACRPAQGLQPYSGPAAWMGSDMENDESWLYVFELAEIEEIEAAMRAVQQRRLPLAEISRQDFPLPSLERTFARMRSDLQDGRGFVLTRGLPLRRYTFDEAQIIYWGLGTHIGRAVSQNGKGELMGHVKVVDSALSDPNKRGYMKPNEAPFHTDTCDVVSLMCWRKAKRGGESFVASAMTVHNIMLEERLDLLEQLYEPFYLDKKEEEQPGDKPYYRLPVFSWKDGRVFTRYSRGRTETAPRLPEVPPLSAKQLEALDYLDTTLRRPGVVLAMDFQVGDIQWLNNYVSFHSRNAYVDYANPAEKRHLLRLWLSVRDGQELPESFLDVYHGDLTPGVRGGIPALPDAVHA